MNKKKLAKFLSVAMTAVMFTSLAVGCKAEPKTEPAGNDQGTAVNANEPAWKKDTSPVTLDWYANFSWFTQKWGDDDVSKYITEKTGVTINYVAPAGNEAEKVNTMIASGDLPDLLSLGWYEEGVRKMVEGELVWDIEEAANKYDPYFLKIANPQMLGWYRQPNGKVYGYNSFAVAPSQYEELKGKLSSNQTFAVRKDIYEAIGSPDMSTPEGFLDALKKAQEKFPQVNGQPLIPMGVHEFTDNGNYTFEGYLQNWLGIPKEKDGKFYDARFDEEYIRWMKTFRKANEEGLIAKDIFIDKRAQMEEKIAQGRYFVIFYQWTDFQGPNTDLYTKGEGQHYIPVMGPLNSKKEDPKLQGPGISGWLFNMISKTTEHPDRAMAFFSYMASEEGQRDTYLGVKGKHWDVIDGKEQFLPEILELRDKDPKAFDEKKYGILQGPHYLLAQDAITTKWKLPANEPARSLTEWTYPYATSYSQYDNTDAPADSDAGVALKEIGLKWGETLPKLIMAKSDAEFDQLMEQFKAAKEKLGYEEAMKVRNEKLAENKKKLGIQ